MIALQPATIERKEDICKFLNRYFPTPKDECAWSNLLTHQWAPEEPYGQMLIDTENDDKIVGFIATIFANRMIGSKEVKTCSLSTWAVSEASRGKGLSMISKLLKRKEILFLDFSANEESRRIFEFYKFKQLEKEEWTFFALPSWSGKKKAYIFDDDIPLEKLSKNDKKFLEENKTSCVKHAFIEQGKEGGLLVVYRKKRQKKLNFIEVLYISNYGMEKHEVIRALRRLAWKSFTFGVVADSRFIGETDQFCIKKPIQYCIYKNTLEDDIPLDAMDMLYSERVLLC